MSTSGPCAADIHPYQETVQSLDEAMASQLQQIARQEVGSEPSRDASSFSGAVANNSEAANVEMQTTEAFSAENSSGMLLDDTESRISQSEDGYSENASSAEEDSGAEESSSKHSLWWAWWPDEVGIDTNELRKAAQTEGDDWFPPKVSNSFNPHLCTYCRVFFDTWSMVVEKLLDEENEIVELRTPFYKTTGQLEISASRGCQICSYFSSIYRERRREYEILGHGHSQHVHSPLGYLSLWRPPNVSPTTAENTWYLCIGVDPEHSISLLPHKSYQLTDLEALRSAETSGSQLRAEYETQEYETREQNSGDQCSLALARKWLEDCRLNHDACVRSHQTRMPTRLIRLDDGPVRLCLSAEQEDCSIYSTLSHCWGELKILRLLESNLSLFCQEIPHDELCKTFCDAINIARSLGFSWLWIDSLCIIQDDIADWGRESTLMSMVYGASSLNISATAAPDGRIGCLFERDPIYKRGGSVAVEIGNEKQIFDFADGDLGKNGIDRTPLSRRAWALQERLLAPRNLHFATSQLFWECRTKSACETFPSELPGLFRVNDCSFPKQNLWSSWHTIVEIYSGSSLTDRKDKLVAIAGIAKRFQEETGDKYMAGIWRKDLYSQLCWHVDSRHENPQVQSYRLAEIPSWSWAAVNASVSIAGRFYLLLESYITLVDEATLDDFPKFDHLGRSNGGALTIKSKFILRCTVKHKTPDYWFESERSYGQESKISIGYNSTHGKVHWDYEDEQDPDGIFILLPIGTFKHKIYEENMGLYLKGIMLKNTGIENGQYERVGMFDIQYKRDTTNPLDLLLQNPLETPEPPRELEYMLQETDYLSVNLENGTKWYTINII